MPDSKKKYLLIFLLFIIALGLIIYTEQKTNAYKKALSEKEALLILDYGKEKERWFKGEVIEGMSILNILETSSFAGNFSFTANSHLVVLDGLANNQQAKWRCYLNDREVKEDLSQKIIKPKDKISCRYR